jgi:hypothetical protein
VPVGVRVGAFSLFNLFFLTACTTYPCRREAFEVLTMTLFSSEQAKARMVVLDSHLVSARIEVEDDE